MTTLTTSPPRQCLRPNLATIIPDKMRKRPLDHRGYPVPWFVEWIDGKPDFRVMDARKYGLAIAKRRCWLCGGNIGKFATFVAGLMCIVTRTSAEPPSHIECAKFAVKGCPFLTIPTAQYRMANLPADGGNHPCSILSNPEVSALWTTDQWQWEPSMANGVRVGNIIKFGDPKSVTYWKQGRLATGAEVQETFWRRLSILEQQAELDGGIAPLRLKGMVADAVFWLPDAA